MNNKQVVISLLTGLAENDLSPTQRHLTQDCQLFFSGNPQPMGLAEIQGFVGAFHAAFSDYQFTVEDVIAGDGKVAVRCRNRMIHTGEWMGLPPTGNAIDYGEIGIFDFRGGQICTAWIQNDDARMMQQLGLTFAPAAG